jgi:hypothetical protein
MITTDLGPIEEPNQVVWDGTTFQVTWRTETGSLTVNTVDNTGGFPLGTIGRVVAQSMRSYSLTGSPSGSLIIASTLTNEAGVFDTSGGALAEALQLDGIYQGGLSAGYDGISMDYLAVSIAPPSTLIGTPVTATGSDTSHQVTLSGADPAQPPTAVAFGGTKYLVVYACVDNGCPALCAVFDPPSQPPDHVIFRGVGTSLRDQTIWNGMNFITVLAN